MPFLQRNIEKVDPKILKLKGLNKQLSFDARYMDLNLIYTW